MSTLRLMAFPAMFLCCMTVMTTIPPTVRCGQSNADDVVLPVDMDRLLRELSMARKAGDIPKVRELENMLFPETPVVPPNRIPAIIVDTFDGPAGITSPQWGNDVEVFSGAIYPGEAKRQICVSADTAGGIYIGLNRVYRDTLSQIAVYRSTNGGVNWSMLGGVYSPGGPMQAFDMCVTDTAGGKWLISVVYVIKTDKSTDGGGHLGWVSFLSDGTNWRTRTIAAAGAGINFRNPSICTDGAAYLPQVTYHYVAAEYVTPSTNSARGLYIIQSTDRGVTWGTPDTSIRAGQEGTPVIAVDHGANPDTLIVAYARGAYPSRQIRIARTAKIAPFSWDTTVPSPQPGDNYDPSMAIDPDRGNAMITYTRFSGSPNYQDVRSFRSSNHFRTYDHDSVAISAYYEGVSSVSFTPWISGYYWRVVYRSTFNDGTIYYKALQSKLSSWYSESSTIVNQHRSDYSIAPVVGFDRDISGTLYRGNVAYVGYGPAGVYFDAADLTLDIADVRPHPQSFSLQQNFPNPFNPSTTIQYGLPERTHIMLTVCNTLGQQVAQLVNGEVEAGHHEVVFDARALSSGVYLYRMQAGPYVETKKFLIVR